MTKTTTQPAIPETSRAEGLVHLYIPFSLNGTVPPIGTKALCGHERQCTKDAPAYESSQKCRVCMDLIGDR